MFKNVFAGKKVLVTGNTGFKGTWLVNWLLELGADITGYSISVPTSPSHFETLNLASRIRDFRGDINDISKVVNVMNEVRPEIVFHLAAQPIVSTSISNPVENYLTNVMGTVNFLEGVRGCDSVRAAVIVTSDKCYENVEWEYGYRETDKLGGKDPYSASKACAEIVFHSYFRTYFQNHPNLQIASARAGNVIGGGDWALDRIVPDNVRAWGSGNVPKIRSPKATRPWQHVLEPLSGYLWLAAELYNGRPGLNGESFNFGPPNEVNATVEALLIEMTKTWSGKKWFIEESGLSKKEAGLLKLSCDKALSRLAWTPTLVFRETVEYTAKWYKTFYQSSTSEAANLTQSQIQEYVTCARERGLEWAQ